MVKFTSPVIWILLLSPQSGTRQLKSMAARYIGYLNPGAYRSKWKETWSGKPRSVFDRIRTAGSKPVVKVKRRLKMRKSVVYRPKSNLDFAAVIVVIILT